MFLDLHICESNPSILGVSVAEQGLQAGYSWLLAGWCEHCSIRAKPSVGREVARECSPTLLIQWRLPLRFTRKYDSIFTTKISQHRPTKLKNVEEFLMSILNKIKTSVLLFEIWVNLYLQKHWIIPGTLQMKCWDDTSHSGPKHQW